MDFANFLYVHMFNLHEVLKHICTGFIVRGQLTVFHCLSKTDLIAIQDFKELNFILITNKLQGNFQLQQAFYFYPAVYPC